MTAVIRPGEASDREPVMAIAVRLAAFGPPPWRTADEVAEGERRTLLAYFDRAAPLTSTLLVADEAGVVAGFTYLEQLQDYFTLEHHGHIGMIAVAEPFEGRGVGASLMRAAEDWARARGYRTLTLSVFEDNRRARRVYEHFGYRPDTLRYLKPLAPPEG